MDRLGDAKDQVRDQDQALLLKIMDQAANPQVLSHLLCSVFYISDLYYIFINFIHLILPVRVGADDGGLQTQEQQDQRGSLSLSHFNLKCVSIISFIGYLCCMSMLNMLFYLLFLLQVWISESDAQ